MLENLGYVTCVMTHQTKQHNKSMMHNEYYSDDQGCLICMVWRFAPLKKEGSAIHCKVSDSEITDLPGFRKAPPPSIINLSFLTTSFTGRVGRVGRVSSLIVCYAWLLSNVVSGDMEITQAPLLAGLSVNQYGQVIFLIFLRKHA